MLTMTEYDQYLETGHVDATKFERVVLLVSKRYCKTNPKGLHDDIVQDCWVGLLDGLRRFRLKKLPYNPDHMTRYLFLTTRAEVHNKICRGKIVYAGESQDIAVPSSVEQPARYKDVMELIERHDSELAECMKLICQDYKVMVACRKVGLSGKKYFTKRKQLQATLSADNV